MRKVLIIVLVMSLGLGAEEATEELSYWERMKAKISLDEIKTTLHTDEILEGLEERASDLKEDLEVTKVLEKLDSKVYNVSQKIDIDQREQEILEKVDGILPDSEMGKQASAGVSAISDLIRASVISNKEMELMADKTIVELDRNHTLVDENSTYNKRLKKLLTKLSMPENLQLDLKVYLDKSVNAFALANGSVRVNSGLLDIMSDDELLFVIGHELGHIKYKHSKDSYRVAYGLSGLQKGAIAKGGMIGSLAGSMVGTLSSHLLNAKFSREEERTADQYGLEILAHNNIDKRVSITALGKIETSSTLFSSHPSSADRIEALKEAQ